jgi:hypothetical protein
MEAINKKAAAVSFVTDEKRKERVECDSALTFDWTEKSRPGAPSRDKPPHRLSFCGSSVACHLMSLVRLLILMLHQGNTDQ